MNIHLIAGARPNFMKIAPLIHAIDSVNEKGIQISYRLIHTGQHYDDKMSDTFFRELHIPKPDANLGCGGGSQAEQTAAILIAYENELLAHPTDLVIVVGDVTSTMACSIVAKKLNTKVAHVEAGIRSFDLSMPEEINRMVTDSITDYFFTTSATANNNLKHLGIPDERIFFVGNVMIDTLMLNLPRLTKPKIWDELDLQNRNYVVMTLHRPSNVDEESKFKFLMEVIISSANHIPILFPVHPRTAKIIQSLNLQYASNLHLIEPLGYLEFNYLVKNSKMVITDSGGITEETTVLGVPCLTLRDNTERPETVELGTNELVGTKPETIAQAINKIFKGEWKKGVIPPLWDGFAAKRIIDSILQL
jgi:UDP-N-acetylglucosamine 2-epimerase (non-hydrolysing)